MSIKKILLLGNPQLYKVSEEVHREELDNIKRIVQDLHDTMMEFRRKYGVGRAIAAPQIGEMKRVIYMNIENPEVFINPKMIFEDDDTIELWDDCMSFPQLIVKVKRYKKARIEYRDLEWNKKAMELEGDLAELLQHEYDHLDGILAVARAINDKSFAIKNHEE
ncbi:MAG: peptide deformylase [Firmicutes bacterium]|nr:peptide deformylase [Bacillota bacterium]